MRIAGRPSWQVTFGDSSAVTIALYVRDVAGLQPRTPPVLPLLEPAVPPAGPRPDPSLDLARATREWEQWWATRDVERTAREWENWWAARAPAGRRRREEPPWVAPDPEWMDQIRAPQPPDFPGFERWPTLRALLERHFEAAARRASEQHSAYADRMVEVVGRRDSFDIGDLVRRSEREFRRTAPPFVLHVTEVPVRGTDGWVVTPRDVLCSTGLLADRARATAFFTPIVRGLVSEAAA